MQQSKFKSMVNCLKENKAMVAALIVGFVIGRHVNKKPLYVIVKCLGG